ncbi:glycosyltransferase [Roseivirga sp.]|uniref:glycosyltransferase n=1 Tax=Roseivirga sp. TaxID=1964215 RepID=UPI003B8B244C
MKKTKVVIASLLKPIDDTRMLDKFGLSIAETNTYDVNIIGFDSKNIRAVDNITFHPLGSFSRLSISRLFKPIKVFNIYIKVKPKVIIANTHELLLVTLLYKILFGATFIYDVRENYAKNIRNTNVFPFLLKPFIAAWVRLKEWVTKPFVNHYILAERVYANQLPFLSKHTTVIENKYMPLARIDEKHTRNNSDNTTLVFTGTIADSNGIFEALSVTKSLYELDDSIELKIVGYCALKSDLMRLKEEIKDLDYVSLNGGDHLVPHSEIVEAIQNADYGFVFKKGNNGMNDEKLLTRLFEYTANKLPILLIDNPHWIDFCETFNAAITMSPHSFVADDVIQQMKSSEFYTKGDTSDSLWHTEAPKLLSLISKQNP